MGNNELNILVLELTDTIDWEYLESQSIASFRAGLKEIQIEKSEEIKTELNLYSLISKVKSLNILDSQYSIPTISLEYEIQVQNKEIGYYKLLVDLDLSILDD
ncbi:MAG: hypothetical protein ABJR05_12925 [Balneola sp.]